MKVRENCDNSLVRPILDYSCTVWNPYRKYQIERLALINTIHASSHICRFSLSFPFPQRYPFWNLILNSIRYFDSLDCFKTALESITLDTPFRQWLNKYVFLMVFGQYVPWCCLSSDVFCNGFIWKERYIFFTYSIFRYAKAVYQFSKIFPTALFGH